MRLATVFLLAATIAAPSFGGTLRPSLKLVRIQPSVTVRGAHFHPSERARVTLTFATTHRVRFVRTSSTGTFAVSLGSLPQFDPCNDSFNVVAVGGPGEHATVKFVPRECPPA